MKLKLFIFAWNVTFFQTVVSSISWATFKEQRRECYLLLLVYRPWGLPIPDHHHHHHHSESKPKQKRMIWGCLSLCDLRDLAVRSSIRTGVHRFHSLSLRSAEYGYGDHTVIYICTPVSGRREEVWEDKTWNKKETREVCKADEDKCSRVPIFSCFTLPNMLRARYNCWANGFKCCSIGKFVMFVFSFLLNQRESHWLPCLHILNLILASLCFSVV